MLVVNYKDDTLTSSEKIDGSYLHIFPNPVNDELFIEVEKGIGYKGIEVKIYSVDGKLITVEKIKIGTTKISTKNLEKGMYFIEIGGKIEKFEK
jgi:hypothetical protein